MCVGVDDVDDEVLYFLQLGDQCARVRHAAHHGVQVEETRQRSTVLELNNKSYSMVYRWKRHGSAVRSLN